MSNDTTHNASGFNRREPVRHNPGSTQRLGRVMPDPSIVVLKFGSSVLPTPGAAFDAADEIRRYRALGQRVVAVVSAVGTTTRRLLDRAQQFTDEPSPAAIATLLSTGETMSAAYLGLALAQLGVAHAIASPAQIGLRAAGERLNAEPRALEAGRVRESLTSHGVLVVPGFTAVDDTGSPVLLGRGGSDLSALFIAERLGARAILLKDADGLYERDPFEPGPSATRFERLTWNSAVSIAGGAVQPKAVAFAERSRQTFTVRAIGSTAGTVIGPGPDVPEGLRETQLAEPAA